MIQELIDELRQCQRWMDENNIIHTNGSVYKDFDGKPAVCALGAMYARRHGIEALRDVDKNIVSNLIVQDVPALGMNYSVPRMCDKETGQVARHDGVYIVWNFNDGHYGSTEAYMTPGEIADAFERGEIVT